MNWKSVIRWTPRIITILFIIFIALFALDVFAEDYTFWQTVVALFMHLIPNYVLIVLLVVAWRWPLIGGALFLGVGVGFTLFFHTYQHLVGFLVVSLPVFILGGLFILQYYFER